MATNIDAESMEESNTVVAELSDNAISPLLKIPNAQRVFLFAASSKTDLKNYFVVCSSWRETITDYGGSVKAQVADLRRALFAAFPESSRPDHWPMDLPLKEWEGVFFGKYDYQMYLELLGRARERSGVEIWAYCLMPNHVHLVVVPHRRDSLAEFFRQAHRTYTLAINAREGWQGHLW